MADSRHRPEITAPFQATDGGSIFPLPDLVALARHRTVHFLGIAGSGMLPLATLLDLWGGRVSGCDRSADAARAALPHRPIWDGHDPAHLTDDCGALVVTSAAPPDLPELLEARRRRLPVLKRAQALAAVVQRGEVMAVAGTHGKTTTTAWIAHVLEAAGEDPTALVGGHVPTWGGPLRLGRADRFIVEADEFDRSFLWLWPDLAVVTTIDVDHLDTYGHAEAIAEAFAAFLLQRRGGPAVLGWDDEGVRRLVADRDLGPTLRYGMSPEVEVHGDVEQTDAEGSRVRVRWRGRRVGEVRVRLPGMHNVRNALAAVAVGLVRGAPWSAIAEGVAAFRGVGRRFEILRRTPWAVVDDYAHHPTEVAATLEAARQRFPGRRIVAVFQPHLYSRTAHFADAFGRALAAADRVLVTDIYPAREAPLPGVTGALVAEAATRAGAAVRYVADRAAVLDAVREELHPGDVAVFLAAGDLTRDAHRLAEEG
jgi:UDP-N-acetylmuramate--alanine ligase